MVSVERKRALFAIPAILFGSFVFSFPSAREAPRLAPELTNQTVTLEFADQTVAKICDSIGKSSGLQFIFDDKTDLDKPLHVDLGTMSLDKALDMLMLQSKNFYKPLDDRTVLVAPDTRQKRQEYEDQVIQTFHLTNVDSKQVVTLLRSLLQSRQISESPTHNSVTIKDTPTRSASPPISSRSPTATPVRSSWRSSCSRSPSAASVPPVRWPMPSETLRAPSAWHIRSCAS